MPAKKQDPIKDERGEENFPLTPKSNSFRAFRAENKKISPTSFSDLEKKVATNVPDEGCLIIKLLAVELLSNFHGKNIDGEGFTRKMFQIEILSELQNPHIFNLKPKSYSEFVKMGVQAENLGKHLRIMPKDPSNQYAPREYRIE